MSVCKPNGEMGLSQKNWMKDMQRRRRHTRTSPAEGE